MEYVQYGSKIVLRLDRGEELVGAVRIFCEENSIRLGSVSGIGAVNQVDVGLFVQETKEYHTKEFRGSMEITSLAGNISQMNGKVYIHLHATLTDATYQAYGGHLNKAVVGATCELFIDVVDGEVDRLMSEEIGLNLISFDKPNNSKKRQD
jgi:predicted DNA-binding protein with PD1-like motif